MPSSRVGMNVYTWGTDNYGDGSTDYNRGMSNAAGSLVWGSNVGHASLLLTLADTQQNRALVEDYLEDTDIPYEYKTYRTKKVIFQKSGESKISDDSAYEENVIEIYFSWWPNNENGSFRFNTFLQDCEQERSGLDVYYEPQWREYLAPTIEKAPWGVGQWVNPTITLGPGLTTHEKDLPSQEVNVLRTYQRAYANREKIKAVFLLINDLNTKNEKKNFTISPAELAIAKNMFPKIAWEKMKADKFIEALNHEAQKLAIANIRSIYDYTRALITLDNHEMIPKLKSELKIMEKRIKKMKSLEEKLTQCNIVLATPEEIASINKLIKADDNLSTRYPKGVTGGNYHEMIEYVNFELHSKEEDSLSFEYKTNRNKLEILTQLYECIVNIEGAKDLLNKIDLYEKTQGTIREKLKREIQQAISVNHELTEFASQGIDKKNLPLLKDKLRALLTPPQSIYFKAFGQAINSPKANIIPELEKEKASELLEQTRTQGTPPNHSTLLPLQTSHRIGLDPEVMIRKMAEFATQGKKFTLLNNNCAVTSSEILAEGAKENGNIFQQRAFNMIATPQMVYNNAVQYTGIVTEQNHPHKKAMKFSPTKVTSYQDVEIDIDPPDKHAHPRRRRGN
ncbi:MAG: hypothetical protein HYX61_04475 [Gammaproteobacteria bacterium]|nr:hypothetical protein [Gammaproteobacteria bacterium]